MSERLRVCLVGAGGLVGSAVIRACVGRDDVRLVAVSRRELALPPGARMEVLLADPSSWADAIAAARPTVVVSALGTTIRQVGGDEAAFRAVDHDLVVACARWAAEAGARQFIAVSAIGADPRAKAFYLRTKGEAEAALTKSGIPRLDLLQPSLLLGRRAERRTAEDLARLVAPLMPLVLHGGLRRYRPIHADTVAEAILALAHEKARGRFIHDYDALHRAIRRHNFERSLDRTKAVD